MSSTPVETSPVLDSIPRRFLELALQEAPFLGMIAGCFLLAALTYNTAWIAAWVGFSFAAYAATTNDSIQTIGTFLASNQHRHWTSLWTYITTIFLVTMSYSWYTFDGDVSFQRLASKGFETAPTQFAYLQVAAPIFLLILTRMKIPVSTTFLCLSGFAASASSVGSVLVKSVSGYGIAFGVSVLLWVIVARFTKQWFSGPAHPAWNTAQWVISGALWAVWLMQDAANVAVYLPRKLNAGQFGLFLALMSAGLLVLFYLRGDRIQQVITEKTNIVDVRAATIVDVSYVAILYYFQKLNNVPMSTTWVFVGLLAGRELGIALARTFGSQEPGSYSRAGRLIVKDLAAVSIGLIVSLLLASVVNDVFRVELLSFLGF